MDTLGDLELLFLLSFTDAPPSHVLTLLKSKGINYRFVRGDLERVIREDERTGTKEGIRTALEEALKELEFKLETFSSRVDSISEVYNITLLVAPVMLYSVGLFQPTVVQTSLWLLLALNALLILLFRDLHPRVFKLNTKTPYLLGLSLLPTAIANLLYPWQGIKSSLLLQSLLSIPLSYLTFNQFKRMNEELKENQEILLKALTTPEHTFRAIPPELLTTNTLFGISKSVRLTLYLSSLWGVEEKNMLLLTYEKIYNFFKTITRKGFLNATMNLLTIFLLGFASAVVKNIYQSLPIENLQQWVNLYDVKGYLGTIDLYVLLASSLYALGLSILSIGLPILFPLWLPLVSVTILAGELLGERLFIHG